VSNIKRVKSWLDQVRDDILQSSKRCGRVAVRKRGKERVKERERERIIEILLARAISFEPLDGMVLFLAY